MQEDLISLSRKKERDIFKQIAFKISTDELNVIVWWSKINKPFLYMALSDAVYFELNC